MKTQGKTIFHVHIMADESDHYFGSIAAIYEKFNRESLGITRWTLYNFKPGIDKAYSNRLCTIKRCIVTIKPKSKKEKVLTKKVVTNSRYI